MAKNKTPAAGDRLQTLQPIDARMNPRRRRKKPSDWAVRGELFLNCSCPVFCPCVVSLGKAKATEGHCHAWMAIAIDQGHFEGEDLTGLNIGLMVEIPGRMAEGNWKVAAYVDERASQKAYNGILKIFSGAAGGSTGLFTMLVSEIIDAEPTKVETTSDGTEILIVAGHKIQGKIEILTGADSGKPVLVSKTKYWTGPDVTAAVGTRSKMRDYGRLWDFGANSARFVPSIGLDSETGEKHV